MAFTTLTVTATYRGREEDGKPAQGTVTMQLSAPMVDSTSKQVVNPRPIKGTLVAGALSIPGVEANNDPTSAPATTRYFVTERIIGSTESSYYVTLDRAAPGGTVDLASLTRS